MKVQLVAYTAMTEWAFSDENWRPDAGISGAESLIEAAGRACYQSWHRPNPATAGNAGYIANILDKRHFSVLEHANATFYFTGVSRSLTHELIRHRHFSYSQLSQRYVTPDGGEPVVPPLIEDLGGNVEAKFREAFTDCEKHYAELVLAMTSEIEAQGFKVKAKQLREAARAVLMNATETKIVVTGNFRAWRHFIAMRATEHADAEIREAAILVLLTMQDMFPNVFEDFEITTIDAGFDVASSPYMDMS